MSHQKGNVLPPLPEGRNPDLDDVEPKEEVLPEPASSHFVVDVAIRRGHEADVYGDRLYPADPAYGALFHGPKELRLKTGVQLAHLVEEERAAVSGLEETLLRNLSSGEGTPVIAEELGLQQTLGNCGAIDREEWSSPTTATPLNRPGNSLLPGPAFAEDQHVGVR